LGSLTVSPPLTGFTGGLGIATTAVAGAAATASSAGGAAGGCTRRGFGLGTPTGAAVAAGGARRAVAAPGGGPAGAPAAGGVSPKVSLKRLVRLSAAATPPIPKSKSNATGMAFPICLFPVECRTVTLCPRSLCRQSSSPPADTVLDQPATLR